VHGCQSPVTGSRQLTDVAGRIIKPGTYFDAGPELTIEKHSRIGIAILQDPTHTERQTQIHRDTQRNNDVLINNSYWHNLSISVN